MGLGRVCPAMGVEEKRAKNPVFTSQWKVSSNFRGDEDKAGKSRSGAGGGGGTRATKHTESGGVARWARIKDTGLQGQLVVFHVFSYSCHSVLS